MPYTEMSTPCAYAVAILLLMDPSGNLLVPFLYLRLGFFVVLDGSVVFLNALIAFLQGFKKNTGSSLCILLLVIIVGATLRTLLLASATAANPFYISSAVNTLVEKSGFTAPSLLPFEFPPSITSQSRIGQVDGYEFLFLSSPATNESVVPFLESPEVASVEPVSLPSFNSSTMGFFQVTLSAPVWADTAIESHLNKSPDLPFSALFLQEVTFFAHQFPIFTQAPDVTMDLLCSSNAHPKLHHVSTMVSGNTLRSLLVLSCDPISPPIVYAIASNYDPYEEHQFDPSSLIVDPEMTELWEMVFGLFRWARTSTVEVLESVRKNSGLVFDVCLFLALSVGVLW